MWSIMSLLPAFFLFVFPVFSKATQVTIVAPADARKEGGLKFRATLSAGSSVADLKTEFRTLHFGKYGAPGYGSFELLSDRTGKVIVDADLSGLEEGEVLTLFRPRGTITTPSSSSRNGIASESDHHADHGGSGARTGGGAPPTAGTSTSSPEDLTVGEYSHDIPTAGLRFGDADGGSELPSDSSSPFYVSDLLFALEQARDRDRKSFIVNLLLRDESKLEPEQVRQVLTAADCSLGGFKTFVGKHYKAGPELPGVLRIARSCDQDNSLKDLLVRDWFEREGRSGDAFAGSTYSSSQCRKRYPTYQFLTKPPNHLLLTNFLELFLQLRL